VNRQADVTNAADGNAQRRVRRLGSRSRLLCFRLGSGAFTLGYTFGRQPLDRKGLGAGCYADLVKDGSVGGACPKTDPEGSGW
jgi:hypothetical protein